MRSHSKLDWNALALVATIELERDQHNNPPVAQELAADYSAAVQSLPAILATHPDHEWSELVVRSAVTCIALARDQRWLARAYFEVDRETAEQWFSAEFGWEFPEA